MICKTYVCIKKGWCYGHDRRACKLWTRPSCILHRSTIDTTVVYTTVVYVTDTTAARWWHTPTKLLPLTSPNPNPNTNPTLTLTLNPNRTLTLTLINPTKPYNICAQIVDTQNNFFRIYKRNFCARRSGVWGGASYCTTAEIRFFSCRQQSHLSV